MVRNTLLEVARGAQLVAGLPAYLHSRLSLEQTRAALHQRLEQRQAAFLPLVRRAYAGRGATPYHELLRAADCEYGDVYRLVRLRGVEGTLEALRQDGVYLTVDEWKGRRPIRRGSQTFQATSDGYRNRATAGVVGASASDSRRFRVV